MREDISTNLQALEDLHREFDTKMLLIESGGDNLAANYSRELADFIIYVVGIRLSILNLFSHTQSFLLNPPIYTLPNTNRGSLINAFRKIDVSGGDKIPRKGGPGITQSDLLVINKTDLAEIVGADLDVMDRDARRMRFVHILIYTQNPM